MIKHHVMTRRCELSDGDNQALSHELERLERQLVHFEPDLCHLTIDVEQHPRRLEYSGSVRLFVLNRALPARRHVAPTVAAFLRRAFRHIEEQLVRFKAKLRREPSFQRRHGLALGGAPGERSAGGECEQPREDRSLLDRALAGDRVAFARLCRVETGGLRRLIRRELAARGQQASERTIAGITSDVIQVAFRRLASRPPELSLAGWLGWLAQTAIRRAELGPDLRFVALEEVLH